MIPEVKLNKSEIYYEYLNREGSMCNAYSPLLNLLDNNSTLGSFSTTELNFDLLHPVDIITQDSYDGSVNLILNDGKNQPRLIGSRFSVIDDGKFKITDHSGFKDTNIYDINTFDADTSLKTIAKGIPQVEFTGLTLFGGSLPCGAYTFYFKLADADGNESEVLAESGIVQLFIGGLSGNSSMLNILPESMRMGLENENTGKSISFTLTNLDTGFDYVHVLYARSSSGNDQASVDTYHKVIFDYPITSGEAKIVITGNELIIGISAEELYVDYADINSVKTQTVSNNVLFFGNVSKTEHDWDELRKMSWRIIPSYGQKANVGTIDYKYTVGGGGLFDSGTYYNPYNVYYRVGYWPDELYRFGVVYIFEDNSLSPVFNIQGVDFLKLNSYTIDPKLLYNEFIPGNYKSWEAEPEDFYFNKQYRLNSRGVIRFPKLDTFTLTNGILKPKPLFINFNIENIGKETPTDSTTSSDCFEKHKIKGLFFVRQTRIPTIISQGFSIGLTGKDFGSLPVIKNISGKFLALSFLHNNLILLNSGNFFDIKSNILNNALLVPDAEMSEATFNLLFVSNKYSLNPQQKFEFFQPNKPSHLLTWISYPSLKKSKYIRRKLTNIPEDFKSTTDGEMYFSTLAGNPSEAYKTSDLNNEWNKSKPLDLTKSISLVRGQWGSFVGIGQSENSEKDEIEYGTIYNIKPENYFTNEEEASELDFLKRFNSAETYHAICDRTLTNRIENNIVTCYRGDCFQSLFTHRMFRNFIDPELPTNDKIINPLCWAQNYAVRCTAIADIDAKYNVFPEDSGFFVSKDLPLYSNEVVQTFEIKEEDDDSGIKWDTNKLCWVKENGEIIDTVSGGDNPVSKYVQDKNDKILIVKPSQQESSGIGGIIKNLFKSSRWAMRGITSINRADVNAVGLGQWITFPICSSRNLSLRDVDYSNATEQASFNKKRSFYPLQKMDKHNPLRDSNIINLATAISTPHKSYYGMPNVPFIKQEFFTRVINSLRDSSSSITNEFKVMLESAYSDYTKIYGPITKLMTMGGKIIVVFHHGIGVLAIAETMSLAKDASQYLPTELNMVITQTYGSMWKDSIIETQGYIYGVDSVAKVIWRISGSLEFEIISQLKVEKFLIDNIDMSEFTTTPYVGRINIKTHYNAFKHDVMFTYYNDILYKFDSDSYDNKTLADWEIDSDGYLINLDGTRSEYQGEKVVAQYNTSTGDVENYVEVINNGSNFKWAKGKSWSICFNEPLGKFITFYDWIPIESENIDNIWFSFDREGVNKLIDKGLSNSYNRYIKPSVSTGNLIRDEHYAKYLIDPAFNTSCPITYLEPNISYEYSIFIDKNTNAIGFYLKPGAEYMLNIVVKPTNNKSTLKYDLTNSSDWLFTVILLNKSEIIPITNVIVDITAINNRGACTDMICGKVDSINISENIKIVVPTGIDYTETYYSVKDLNNSARLWKHGLAGLYDGLYLIKPAHWYGLQHEFNFEFIARKDAMHKVFNNLYIISNKAEPHKFEFEVVGEAYDWYKYKPVLKWIADQIDVPTDNRDYDTKLELKFLEVLSKDYGTLCKDTTFPRIFGMKSNDKFAKLPFIKVTDAVIPSLDPQIIGNKLGEKDNPDTNLTPELQGKNNAYSDNTSTAALVYDKQLNEFRVHTEQLGNDMWKYGRLRGNMQYLEDLWRVEIRPISFKWVYLHPDGDSHKEGDHLEGLGFSKIQETRHRDKYIKIKVRYSGEDLAVIQAISTIFDYSYA